MAENDEGQQSADMRMLAQTTETVLRQMAEQGGQETESE